MDIPLGENEILIKVKSCGISYWDILAKEGYDEYSLLKTRKLDKLLNQKHLLIESGYEVCGIVEKVGSGAETFFKVGNEVVGILLAEEELILGICPLDTKCGGCAQYTVQDCVNFGTNPNFIIFLLASY